MLIRNDDVCVATTARHLQRFCEITDKCGYRVLHAVTLRGVCWRKDGWLGSLKNSEIVALGAGKRIEDNTELIEFMRSRTQCDVFGIHGLWHVHRPSVDDIIRAREIFINDLKLYPLFFVPPFNEGRYKSHDFLVSGAETPCMEGVEVVGSAIASLHSWRYDPEMWMGTAYGEWWTFGDLERRLAYSNMKHSEANQEKYDFLAPRIEGRWLDVGCNTGRLLKMAPDGFGIDNSSSIELPENAMLADAAKLPFQDNTFDTVVLCGVLEQCNYWELVLREAQRVARIKVIGTCPYPGTRYGLVGATEHTRSVILPRTFKHVEHINDGHYYFEVRK